MADYLSDSFINVTPGGQTSLYLKAKFFASYSIVNSNAVVPVLSVTVPANTLTAESSLLIWLNGSGTNTTGVNQSLVVTVKFGATSYSPPVSTLQITNGAGVISKVYMNGIISNESSTSAQIFGGSAISGTSPLSQSRVMGGTSAEDTTQDQTLEIDLQLGAADPNLAISGGVTVLAIG